MKKIKTILRSAAVFAVTICMLAPLSACSGKKDTVMSLGSFDVSLKHYRYLYLNIRRELEEPGINENKLDSDVRDIVMQSLRHTAAVKNMADERKISLSKDQKKEINDYIKGLEEIYSGKDELEKELAAEYLDEDFLKYATEIQQLEVLLREKMTAEYGGEVAADDKTIEADIKQNFYLASQILLSFDNEDSDNKSDLAAQLLDRAKNGEDFSALVEQYSEDTSGDPRCFTSGQLIEEFENAVKKINPGEIYPDVVESEAGFHIIKRLELTDEYIDEHFSELREAYTARRFNEEVEKCANSLEIEEKERYGDISTENLLSYITQTADTSDTLPEKAS